eukprot:753708-Hanusia_phi.AAC.1
MGGRGEKGGKGEREEEDERAEAVKVDRREVSIEQGTTRNESVSEQHLLRAVVQAEGTMKEIDLSVTMIF